MIKCGRYIKKLFGVHWIWPPSPSVIWSSHDTQRINLYSLNQSFQLHVSIKHIKKCTFCKLLFELVYFFTTIVMSRKVKGKLCLASHTMYEPRVLKLFVTKILHMICGFRHDRYTTSSVYSEFLQNLADFTSYWIKIRRNSESL